MRSGVSKFSRLLIISTNLLATSLFMNTLCSHKRWLLQDRNLQLWEILSLLTLLFNDNEAPTNLGARTSYVILHLTTVKYKQFGIPITNHQSNLDLGKNSRNCDRVENLAYIFEDTKLETPITRHDIIFLPHSLSRLVQYNDNIPARHASLTKRNAWYL